MRREEIKTDGAVQSLELKLQNWKNFTIIFFAWIFLLWFQNCLFYKIVTEMINLLNLHLIIFMYVKFLKI